MCTVITFVGLSRRWPVLVAAIRDEATHREWLHPASHWSNYPNLLGGLDISGGGTWLAVDPKAYTAAFLINRQEVSTTRRQSRGQLPLWILASNPKLHPQDLAPFDGFILGRADSKGISIWEWDTHNLVHRRLQKGLYGMCFQGIGVQHPRLQRHIPRFAAASLPNPQLGEPSLQSWGNWLNLLAGDETPPEDNSALLWSRKINGVPWSSQSASCIAIGHNALRFDFSSSPACPDSWVPIAG